MAKGTATTKSIDRGEGRVRDLIAEMQRTPTGPHVKVGVLASAGEHKEDGGASGLTVVEIAVWNEFGTSRTPERAFMRTSAKALMPIIAALGASALGRMIDGKLSLDQALDLLGLKAQAVIKKTINDWKSPPNAEATILAKARKTGRAKIAKAFGKGETEGAAALAAYDNPLVDTGQLRNSVQYEKIK